MIHNPVLGAIIGDMIGVPYECLRYGAQVRPDFPLWKDTSTFSDDSVMTIAVAEWLLYPPFNTYNLTSIMQKWGRKYRHAGYGHLFGKWIDSDNPKPYNSFGNGSAMRVSPVGCAFHTEETTLIMAEQSASVSHNHPEGVKGAKCIADCIYCCLHDSISDNRNGYSVIDLLPIHLMDYNYNLKRTPEEIKKSGYKFDSTCQGSVPEAICCFLNSDSYEETVRKAVLLRGDTDTQACMAGALAAAYWGIPENIAEEGKSRLPEDLYIILSKFSNKYNLDL